jgi:predicted phosphoadenosine phosphosulfate sulfurtransferase
MALRLYSRKNVLDTALDRIRWLFDEFPNVVVGFSGGKDSTVTFNLALQVAREKGRLPLRVMFLDQEAEWMATIEQVRRVMTDPDVEPLWLQVPIRLFNATSSTEHWLYCWDEKDRGRWMREREPYALTENNFGTDRFGEMFQAVFETLYPGVKTCYLAGVRTEESPTRMLGLTHYLTYKWVTWGKRLSKKHEHFTMYPLYDWSYTDIWKAIFDHDWSYNTIYDSMYAYGVSVRDMRVSNVHHETAVHALFFMQEVEPETYVRLTARISGIDMAGKMGKDDYFVKELPHMFASWREYRDYLLDKLIDSDDWKLRFRSLFESQDRMFDGRVGDKLYQMHVSSILTNDWEGIKAGNFSRAPENHIIRKRVRAEREANEHRPPDAAA